MILITLLLITITTTEFAVGMEGTVPVETCKFLSYNFRHVFNDPTHDITVNKISPNKETLDSLKTFIVTAKKRCSISVKNITYDEKRFEQFTEITERTQLLVSADKNITKATDRLTELKLCLDALINGISANSLKLNVSGDLKAGINGGRARNAVEKSCCHVLYQYPVIINKCCRPGFVEKDDYCACPKGHFLNKSRCDACPENTYQPKTMSIGCLSCPDGTLTYGRRGAESLSSCLQACSPGKRYNSTSERCEACEKNTYQPLVGQTFCTACPNNTVTEKTGNTKKEDCVEYCSEGTFYSLESRNCELCPKNTFQPGKGQFKCISCESDRITTSNGSKIEANCIKNCSRGLFFNQTTQECEGCPLHTFQQTFASTKCNDCPNGRITVNTSSKTQDDCIQNCPAGTAYNFTSKNCVNCPLNTFQPHAGQTACLSCPSGKITVNTSTVKKEDCIKECEPGLIFSHEQGMCTFCTYDTYKPTRGQTECIKCPNGTVTYKDGPNINITDCGEECKPGNRFNRALWRCEKCPRNTTQPNKGLEICITCPADRPITEHEGTVEERDCIGVCQPGSFYDKTQQNCKSCEKKSYQPNSGASRCEKCPQNHTTFETESTALEQCVKECSPGSHHVNKTEKCILCEKDSYQSQSGQESCIKCENGEMAFHEGSTDKAECFAVCTAGHYHNNVTKICDPCPRNTYQPLQRQFNCTACPQGTVTQFRGTTSFEKCLWECDKGFYHDSKTNTCKECPIGTYKDITGRTACVECGSGYTTITNATVSFLHCIENCGKGQYYNTTRGKCLPCPQDSYQDQEGELSCKLCPNGRITNETGARSINECFILEIEQSSETSSGEDLRIVVGIPVVLTVVVITACLLALFSYRKWRIKENIRRMSGRPLDPRGRNFTDSDPETGERPKLDSIASNHHYRMNGTGLKPDTVRPSIRIANIPPELEIPRENLKFLGQVLGKGNFGKVEKAILLKDGTENVVAVKMIKGGGTFSDEKELFDELEMLASISPNPHPNIVNLVGGSTDSNGPLFVVVEYCGEGNLLKYLQKHQVQTRQEYVNIIPKAGKAGLRYEWKLQKALEVCHGMAHLAKFKIIHRDVAARNVLLDDHLVAKISDFGMARDIYVKQIYRKDTEGFLPVRWMAIESLESFIYTTQSDVWSFGILLWEIISDGRVPYNNILDHTQLLNFIKSGRIMKRPKNCPKDLYHIMVKCWSTNPEDRPSFKSLEDALEVLYEDEVNKDEALPQRIFRKFSSRRKRRKNDGDNDNSSGGKSRAKKTLSNSSGKKIPKIEEEEDPDLKTNKRADKNSIKMGVLEAEKPKETVSNKFENQGYRKSRSSTSEGPSSPNKNNTTLNANTSELGRISEAPASRQMEGTGSFSPEDKPDVRERTLFDNVEASALSSRQDIGGNEHITQTADGSDRFETGYI
ncbi:receptor tyrosine-protein kinase let-23-like isoform X2 [Dendronephthya gigantea]|uniref:receptor tyrosine-protein kinase let-23-like isoform X2 n=1 Tax=Dendronephthya gigantea TaxID=151771 RepID=UPI00106B9D67|nr:receptor tyrosine-protein kinase let-23-like isoform X2 [Dendronephthya gigantea]